MNDGCLLVNKHDEQVLKKVITLKYIEVSYKGQQLLVVISLIHLKLNFGD